MRIAGSLPDLPQRLMVKGETRRREATSLIVKRSGKSEREIFELNLFFKSNVDIIYRNIIINYNKIKLICQIKKERLQLF